MAACETMRISGGNICFILTGISTYLYHSRQITFILEVCLCWILPLSEFFCLKEEQQETFLYVQFSSEALNHGTVFSKKKKNQNKKKKIQIHCISCTLCSLTQYWDGKKNQFQSLLPYIVAREWKYWLKLNCLDNFHYKS